MGWWTIEYGLVGDFNDPKIYGAGLLSSVAESYHCFNSDVKKIPFSLDCVNVSYDITKPQPQLFVTPDFPTLARVLEELADRMSFRRGGMHGLITARRAKTVTTTEFDSGIQISGVLSEVLSDEKGEPCYLRYAGPCQLANGDVELKGHGPEYHKEGFGTPVGKLRGLGKSPANLTPAELKGLGGKLEFESGVVVEGQFVGACTGNGLNLVLSFENCTVKRKDQVLFKPDWGTFDMACGASVKSVFGGAADRGRYLRATGGYRQKPGVQKTNLTAENKSLDKLYKTVREARESVRPDPQKLATVYDELEKRHPNEWLLCLELLELAGPWQSKARARLESMKTQSKDLNELISRGLATLKGGS
jgi:phenylalanine-4-hydroxylase